MGRGNRSTLRKPSPLHPGCVGVHLVLGDLNVSFRSCATCTELIIGDLAPARGHCSERGLGPRKIWIHPPGTSAVDHPLRGMILQRLTGVQKEIKQHALTNHAEAMAVLSMKWLEPKWLEPKSVLCCGRRTPPPPRPKFRSFCLSCSIFARSSHDSPRAQTCTFEGPRLQKHHQNSTRRHQRGKKRTNFAAGEGQKRAKFWAVPGRAVPGEGRSREGRSPGRGGPGRAVPGRAVPGRAGGAVPGAPNMTKQKP